MQIKLIKEVKRAIIKQNQKGLKCVTRYYYGTGKAGIYTAE
jgi:hypothetical protein